MKNAKYIHCATSCIQNIISKKYNMPYELLIFCVIISKWFIYIRWAKTGYNSHKTHKINSNKLVFLFDKHLPTLFEMYQVYKKIVILCFLKHTTIENGTISSSYLSYHKRYRKKRDFVSFPVAVVWTKNVLFNINMNIIFNQI